MPCLILDCDGVLIDTEQGHLRAFNDMWRELGIPWSWSPEQYADKLLISGGRERMASLYDDPGFRACWPVPGDYGRWLDCVDAWHRRKSEIFRDLVRAGKVSARPGVRRLVDEALDGGWGVAVASSAATASVIAVVEQVMGRERAAAVSIIGGTDVPRKKPAPDLYLRAAEVIGAMPRDCVAVEDTRNGLLAAAGAGMPCVITPTDLTRDQDFTGAAFVVTCLGDPGGVPCQVVSGPAPVTGACLRLTDLEDVLGLVRWSG
jgi:HAD superfamily hydrolase (TIGR01509 family)